jgi:hypothetical protein
VKPIPSATEANTSWIKLNRLKNSYTWNIQVAAASSSIEDLRAAREKAVTIASELQAVFGGPVEDEQGDEPVSF